MGLRGPAPKPKKDLERDGSWLAKDRPPELTTDGSAPTPPKGMTKDAADEWKRLVAILHPKGALGGDLDRQSLTFLCEAVSEYNELNKLADKCTTGSNDWAKLLDKRNDAFKRWNDLSKRFGLTPADRPRVKVNAPAKANDKSKFFNGGPVVGKIGA